MTFNGLIWLGTLWCFAVMMLMAALSDLKSLIIENRVCLAIALLYPAFVISAPYPVDWMGAVKASSIIFGVGFILFAIGVTGGGDVKLLAASALWIGPGELIPFLFVTGICGAFLSIAVWLNYRISVAPHPRLFFMLPLRAGLGEKVPYGVAISIGAIYVAFTNLGLA